MRDRFDITTWPDTFSQAAVELGTAVAGLLATLALAGAVLAVSGAVAFLIAAVVRVTLRGVGVDRVATRWTAASSLEQVGIHLVPSEIVSKLLFWGLFLAVALVSVETLGLTLVTTAVDRVLSFLPNLLSALIVVLVGLLASRAVGAIVSSAASVGGMRRARRLGFFVQVLLNGLVLVVAFEQVGLSTDVVVAPLTALVATAGFAAALAFALGARPIITHILAGHFLRESLPRDASVEINGERGIVERIGATDTLLRNDDKTWSVPNARLLDEVVVR